VVENPLRQLIVNEQTLQRILDFLPYPFLVSKNTSDGWRIVLLNQKFTHEIGYRTEQIPSLSDWFPIAYPDELYRAAVEEEWNRKIAQALENDDDAVSMQVLINTRLQGKKWYEVKASIADDMQMVAFIDIHEVREREEKLKRMNENRDRILSILGHDLRGPISNLHVLSKMLINNQVSKEEFIQMIGGINSKAFKTMEFLSTTLAWAKSNFDTFTARAEKVEVKEIFSNVVSLYADMIAEKNISIKPELLSPTEIFSDREIVTSVLRNLLSNAIKFSHPGGAVALRAHHDKDNFFIEVEDEGTGIEAAKIAELSSNKSFSLEGTKGEKGLGIGLSLCKDLMRRVGGELHIESTAGKGTLARVVLPGH
jgi:signal transduction histidine kinase